MVARFRALPTAAILAFVLTRGVLMAHVHAATDIRFYHAYFLRAAAGEVPYRDIAIAYPPVAWWVMAWPNATDWPTYRDRFRRIMLVFDVASFGLFTAILLRRRPSCVGWGCLTYVAATAILEHLLYDRLDVGLLFLLMLWAYAWVRSLTDAGPRGRSWVVVSYVALGVGVAYKLVPVVMVPFVLLSERRSSQDREGWRTPLVHAAAFAIGVAFSLVVQYPSAGLKTLDFLKYHVGRGIQIESVYALVLFVTFGFGRPLSVADMPDTVELVSTAVPAMVWLSNVLTLGFVGVLGLWALSLGRQYDRQTAYVFAGLALAGLILFAKGLSPQYFIWIIPMLLLCGVELLSMRRFVVLCALLVVLAALTTAIFPLGLRALLALEAPILWVLAARDLLFGGLVFWMAAQLLRGARLEPAR